MRTFELYRNDIKQTWSVIKYTFQKTVRCPDSANLVLKDRMVTSLDEIADEFNKYLVKLDDHITIEYKQLQPVTITYYSIIKLKPHLTSKNF